MSKPVDTGGWWQATSRDRSGERTAEVASCDIAARPGSEDEGVGSVVSVLGELVLNSLGDEGWKCDGASPGIRLWRANDPFAIDIANAPLNSDEGSARSNVAAPQGNGLSEPKPAETEEHHESPVACGHLPGNLNDLVGGECSGRRGRLGRSRRLDLAGIRDNRAVIHGHVEDAAQQPISDGQRRGASSWHGFCVPNSDSLGRHFGEGAPGPRMTGEACPKSTCIGPASMPSGRSSLGSPMRRHLLSVAPSRAASRFSVRLQYPRMIARLGRPSWS